MSESLSPAELLDERMRLLKSTKTPEQMSAFFVVAVIAIKAVLRAAEAGNVQCQIAREEMKPHLARLLK